MLIVVEVSEEYKKILHYFWSCSINLKLLQNKNLKGYKTGNDFPLLKEKAQTLAWHTKPFMSWPQSTSTCSCSLPFPLPCHHFFPPFHTLCLLPCYFLLLLYYFFQWPRCLWSFVFYILTILSLLIHEYDMYLHLIQSFKKFLNILWYQQILQNIIKYFLFCHIYY